MKYFEAFLFVSYFSNVQSRIFEELWDKEIELRNDVILKIKSSDEDVDGNRWLTLEISAPTTGYLGVGFSPNGGMDRGHMAVGWVDTFGKLYLKEYHADKYTMIEDPRNDFEILHGKEENGRTIITFKRQWDTCDPKDVKLTKDTMRVIWAYGEEDPTDGIIEEYHGENRGMKHVYLIDDDLVQPFPDETKPSTKYIDFFMKNNTIGSEPSTYYCKIVRFPKQEKKHQMIGYKPIFTPGSNPKIHHITAYACFIPQHLGGTEKTFENFINHEGGRCYTPQLPKEWAKHCFTFLFVWLVGSEGEMFPQHVGIPLTEDFNGPTYIMFEMHYTNPSKIPFTDSSGVRIYYTDELRQYDSSIILAGYRITPFMALPPKQGSFKLSGICSSECTKKSLPETGIKVFGVILHAHLTARKIRTRHFRNNIELPLLAEENAYDFNYQQARYFKQEITILPGDEIITECEFETYNRTDMTLGGMESVQEMCQTFLFYYPKIAMDYCASQSEFYSFFKAFGIYNVTGDALKAMDMPYHPKEDQYFEKNDDAKALEDSHIGSSGSVFDTLQISEPENLKQYTAGNYLRNVAKWDEKEFSQKVQDEWNHGDYYAFCSIEGKRRVHLDKYIIPLNTNGIYQDKSMKKKSCV